MQSRAGKIHTDYRLARRQGFHHDGPATIAETRKQENIRRPHQDQEFRAGHPFSQMDTISHAKLLNQGFKTGAFRAVAHQREFHIRVALGEQAQIRGFPRRPL